MPHLKEILSQFLDLSAEVESSSLLDSMMIVLEDYPEQVKEMAPEILEGLLKLFANLLERKKGYADSHQEEN